MKEINLLGIDLAKQVFQLHGLDKERKVVLKKTLSRPKLNEFMVNLKPCTVGMEACGGSNYWARVFRGMGHEVKLIPPQYVKPYVKRNKNDAADAAAIAEALSCPEMRFVPIKEVFHQDIQSIHRIRQRLVRSRTALSNEIRGLLHEYGIVIPKGISQLKRQIPEILANETHGLTGLMRGMLRELLEELESIEERIKDYDRRIVEIYRSHEACQRIGKIEGVGPLTATIAIAAISQPQEFKNGRQCSAWLGLVPRQHSSGGKTRLLSISKRGDRYLRTLLIHGARSVLLKCGNKKDRLGRWLRDKRRTRGFNKACVALANKNARKIWALLASGEEYRKNYLKTA